MAEYVRQYQLKHANFNRHRKYKHLRPLCPLGVGATRLADQGSRQITDSAQTAEPSPSLEGVDRPVDPDEEAKRATATSEPTTRAKREVPQSLEDLEFEAMLARLEKKCANLAHPERTDGSGLKDTPKEEVSTTAGTPSEQQEQRPDGDITPSDAQTEPEEGRSPNFVARAWWQYAIRCVVKDNRQHSTGKLTEF